MISLTNAVLAAEPLPLTLHRALEMALERNVEAVVASERVGQAFARLGRAASTLLPQAEGSLSDSRQTRNLLASGIKLPAQDPLVGPFNSYDLRITVTQTLFDAAAFQRFRASRAGKELSEYERRKIREDVLALAATLYVDARRAEESRRVARAYFLRDKVRLSLAKQKLRIGTASELDVREARAQAASSLHRMKQSRSDALEKRLDLAAALGLPQDQPIQFGVGSINSVDKSHD